MENIKFDETQRNSNLGEDFMVEKAILLGLDGVCPELIKKYVSEDNLPNIAALLGKGVFARVIPCFPPITPTNWTTIVTGAYPTTHGIMDFGLHIPGGEIEAKSPRGADVSLWTTYCKAEHIWDVLKKNGRKSIILRYPCAYPPTIKKGIVVDGEACPLPSRSSFELASPIIYATQTAKEEALEQGIAEYMMPYGYRFWRFKINVKPAEKWRGLPHSLLPPLEAVLPIRTRRDVKAMNEELYLLIISSSKEGYDKVYLSLERDASKPIDVLKVGQWSRWFELEFETNNGKVVGTVQFKLIELSSDGSKIKIFRNQIMPVKGWSYPEEISSELVRNVGPYVSDTWSISDIETWLENSRQQAEWLGKAAKYLTSRYEWSLLLSQFHLIDHLNHSIINFTHKDAWKYDEKNFPPEKYWKYYEKAYQICDFLVGQYYSLADDETIMAIVSDHGGIPQLWAEGEMMKAIYKALEERGLITFRQKDGRKIPDWKRSKVFKVRNDQWWINLKGREPYGIVEPEEYEAVRDALIDALYSVKDPKNGRHPVTMAIRREEADSIGHGGSLGCDLLVIYTAGYGDEHAFQMPTSKIGEFSNSAIFAIAGPGVKRGYELSKPVRMVDIAPTMAYLLRIPPPTHSEGAIIHEALEKPLL